MPLCRVSIDRKKKKGACLRVSVHKCRDAISRVCLRVVRSAYEQKRAGAGVAKRPCPGTPLSPMQQHYSPKPAAAGRPDAGYMNPAAASQPLPSNTYPLNAR